LPSDTSRRTTASATWWTSQRSSPPSGVRAVRTNRRCTTRRSWSGGTSVPDRTSGSGRDARQARTARATAGLDSRRRRRKSRKNSMRESPDHDEGDELGRCGLSRPHPQWTYSQDISVTHLTRGRPGSGSRFGED
jgi:hypothetical protein